MQSKEFEHLIQGDPAQWAQFSKIPNLTTLTEKKEFKKEIQQNQIPIPENVQSEINRFMTTERQKGTKERTIRRMVKRKWNITVV